MTRVIGGSAGGRRLRTPPGEGTRPTSDRVREALFSAVQAWAGTWEGLRVLDLYAGSGALGLEAWSRGAEAVTLVEHERRAIAVIELNARDLGAPVDLRARAVDAVLAVPPPASDRYDLVLMDPPYPLDEDELAEVLAALADGWLAPDALVVVERGSRSPEPRWPAQVEAWRSRRYGETTLWYGRAAASPPPEEV